MCPVEYRPPSDKEIGEFMETARENKELSQDASAELVGKTRQAVTKWEKGLVPLHHVRYLAALAHGNTKNTERLLDLLGIPRRVAISDATLAARVRLVIETYDPEQRGMAQKLWEALALLLEEQHGTGVVSLVTEAREKYGGA